MIRSLVKKIPAALAALMLVLACGFATGCQSSNDQQQVAATIMGQTITEDEVTEYIDNFRKSVSCTDDDDWASYLESSGMTADDYRQLTIYELASPIVVKNKAQELGIEADEDEVEATVSQIRSSLLAEDDDDWQEVLEQYNTTEEKMYETYRNKNLREKVIEAVIDDIDPTKDDVKNYIEQNLLGETTKYVEVAYGPDYSTMQSKFSKVEKSSSIAKSMKTLKAKADDTTYSYQVYGWDTFANISSTVSSTIEDLSKGEIADHAVSDEGYYVIVYVKDTYTFPTKIKKLDMSSMPKSLSKKVEKATASNLKSSAGSLWIENQIETNITINDMPSGLSYDVSTEESGQGEASTSGESAATSGETTSTSGDSSSK